MQGNIFSLGQEQSTTSYRVIAVPQRLQAHDLLPEEKKNSHCEGRAVVLKFLKILDVAFIVTAGVNVHHPLQSLFTIN